MTGFAFAYAVMRVCGGQPRKNPGAPKITDKRRVREWACNNLSVEIDINNIQQLFRIE